MTLYDEYRKQYPIDPESSEFRDIVESEIKRVIEWMESRKPLPAEEIKPGRYLMRETIEVVVDVVQGSNGLWVRSTRKQEWVLPLEYHIHKGATFRAVEEG